LGLILVLATGTANAVDLVKLDGHLVQGGLVVGTTEPGARVRIDGREVRVSWEGKFLLAFDRDAPAGSELKLALPDGTAETRQLAIGRRDWIVQRIDGLPQQQVTPDPGAMKRIQAENALLAQARRLDTDAPHFTSGFLRPVGGPVSGVFGSQRILNGEPRSPHRGIDIAAPAGATVVAFADGTVALVHQDLFFTGKTVMIDHGHGLKSVYAHLSDIAVRNGQPVRKGQTIGKVGASGRATGPHLHWGVSVFDTYVDPELLTPSPSGP
jgi:murein DD-endopeptidase MepM/ murein hydrolase activator NlpD